MPITIGRGPTGFGQIPPLRLLQQTLSKGGGGGRRGGGGSVGGYTGGIYASPEFEKFMDEEREAKLKQRERQREEEEKLYITDYSPQQRQRWNQLESSAQEVEQMVAKGEMKPEQGQVAIARIHMEQQTMRPRKRLRGPNDPYFEHPPGTTWTDEDGNRHTTEMNGRDVVQVPYYRTKEYMDKELETKKQIEDTKLQREKENQQVSELSKLIGARIDVFNKRGQKIGTRPLNDTEIQQKMQKLFPELKPIEERQKDQARAQGVPVGEEIIKTESDERLPGGLGDDQAFVRHMNQKYIKNPEDRKTFKGMMQLPSQFRDRYWKAVTRLYEYRSGIGGPQNTLSGRQVLWNQ